MRVNCLKLWVFLLLCGLEMRQFFRTAHGDIYTPLTTPAGLLISLIRKLRLMSIAYLSLEQKCYRLHVSPDRVGFASVSVAPPALTSRKDAIHGNELLSA